MNFIKSNYKGLLLCLCLAIPSWFAGKAFPIIGGAVIAIIPITLVLAFMRTRKASSENNGTKVSLKSIFPMFILYFILASVITTIAVSAGADISIFNPVKELSKFFIVLAMAAIGLNTNIIKLIKTGGKPIVLGFCCWVSITGVSLLMQHIIGLW